MSSDSQINLDQILRIEDELLEYEPHLLRLSIFLGLPQLQTSQIRLSAESLDATISLGTIAVERNFIRPEIVDESVVIIKDGRHPLQVLGEIFLVKPILGACCGYIYSKRYLSFHGKKYWVDHWM